MNKHAVTSNQPSARAPGIVIRKLSKRYSGSDRYALHNLTVSVQPGEVYGFLGPNGAGKSTTIRLLMNFIQPTHGEATILGQHVVTDSVAVKRSVGYLAGDLALYPKMTGQQFLAYMHELQPATSPTYMRELVKRLQAELDRPLGELSRGNRQKIGIVQAFMHQPAVLILDEPTSGLDPLMQEVFYELIKEARERGATIFMSSHILSEVQKTCDRVGFIRDGQLVSERSIADLITEAAQIFTITFAGKVPISELKKTSGVRLVTHKDNEVVVHMHGKLAALFAVLAEYDVVKIDARSLDLEEMFLHFYQNKGAMQ